MESVTSTEQSTNNASESRLFQPIRLGTTQLAHRVVLAPLTRYRANKAHVPTDLHVEYYSQRASVAGTHLITEATYISANGAGQDNIPGIWSEEQIAAWKRVSCVYLCSFLACGSRHVYRSPTPSTLVNPHSTCKYGLSDEQPNPTSWPHSTR